MSFEITYELPDWEWVRAKRNRRDDDFIPTIHFFFGYVTTCANGTSFFERGAINMSVADLAAGFAEILDEGLGLVDRPSETTFEQGDDALKIHFRSDGGRVEITGEGVAVRSLGPSR